MTEHLGGPETPEKLRERQGRYERLEGGDRMFKIVDTASGAGVGSVGYWTREWRDEHVYEIGWMVVPDFQGRGIAVAATAQAIERAKRDDKHRFMHAFPGVDNAPSNAICRQQRSVSGSRSSDHSLCATPGGMTTQSPARTVCSSLPSRIRPLPWVNR
jgi:GNAT superfamily N-acetyltransferase